MYAAIYSEQYLEKVFYFCLRKTGNEHDAEELAGEISCEVLASLKRGAEPHSFQAWVWRVARNRWARWVRERRSTPPIGDVDGLPLPSEEDVEQAAVASEELRELRQALAFIRSDYRTLLVAHYFEEKSLPAIARSLGLPLGTVKTRLIRSRRELKEGMDMARAFGKRSFAPEDVSFTNGCSRFGRNGQPWTILEHLLYKNIFLEVYNNPETAEELSLEMGVALPYMEAELDYLTRETFLVKKDGRYETAFPIISREAQEGIAKRCEEIAPELTALLIAELEAYAAACERIGDPVQGPYQSWEDAKWTLLMRAVDIHRWAISSQRPWEYTQRPDGGAWDIIGFETVGLETPQPVGQHGDYVAEHETLPFVQFNAYRFNFRDIRYRTKNFYEHPEIYALKLVCEGKAAECEPERLDRLVEYGLIRREGETFVPCVLVFRDGEATRRFNRFSEEERAAIHGMARRIEALLRELRSFEDQALTQDLPAAFRKDERLREIISDQAVNERGYVLEQAFRDGWLKDDEHTARSIGMWLWL